MENELPVGVEIKKTSYDQYPSKIQKPLMNSM
jgi:hypothetical protein